MQTSKILLLALFLAAGVAACGGGDDGNDCEDVVCLEGTTCVVEDSGPACIPI